MGIYVNPGNENFKSAVISEIYVDKTGLLEYTNSVIGTEQRYICVSRPRRFGKSVTADMLAAYYGKGCDSRGLFQGLEISGSPGFSKHLNRYDIIKLDITAFRRNGENAGELLRRLNMEVISELRESYGNVLRQGEDYLPSALADIHNKTGTAFIFIIDEWDEIFRESRFDEKAQKAYLELLRGLFKGGPSKKFIPLAYLTGILPIKKYNGESALNNFREFTMTNPRRLARYVGFTEIEVRGLCEKYGMDFLEAQRWYDGYSFRNMHHIYSPNSIVNAMLDGEFSNYWTSTAAYESLRSYINMNFDGLKDTVIQMLAGIKCKVDIHTFENDMDSFRQKDDVLTVLIHLGYLAYDNSREEAYVPNDEVRAAFYRAVKGSGWESVMQAIHSSDALLKDTWNRDAEAVAAGVERVHMENISILSYNDENALSCVITLAYYNAVNEYTLVREMPAGKGYADIVFLPKKYSDKPAMIIELKYDHTAEGAVAQIQEKQYMNVLEEYSGNVLLVGINYNKKLKCHSCVIEEWIK